MISGSLHAAVMDDLRCAGAACWGTFQFVAIDSQHPYTGSVPAHVAPSPATLLPSSTRKAPSAIGAGDQVTPRRRTLTAKDILTSPGGVSDLMSRATSKTWWSMSPLHSIPETNKDDVHEEQPVENSIKEVTTTSTGILPTLHFDVGVYVGTNSVVAFDAAGGHVASLPFASARAVGWRCASTAGHQLKFAAMFASTVAQASKADASHVQYAELELVMIKIAQPLSPEASPLERSIVVCGIGHAGVENLKLLRHSIEQRWDAYLAKADLAPVTTSVHPHDALIRPTWDAIVFSSTTGSISADGYATNGVGGSRGEWENVVSPHRALSSEFDALKKATRHHVLTSKSRSIASPTSMLQRSNHAFRPGLPIDADISVIGSAEVLPTAPSELRKAFDAVHAERHRRSQVAEQSKSLSKVSTSHSISAEQPSIVWRSVAAVAQVITDHRQEEGKPCPPVPVTAAPKRIEYPITCVKCGEVFDLRYRADHLKRCQSTT